MPTHSQMDDYKGKVPTRAVIIAFETEASVSIRLGLLTFRVVTYVPQPMKCGQCQRYGHDSKSITVVTRNRRAQSVQIDTPQICVQRSF